MRLQEGHRLMKFDPTISTGTLVQIAVFIVAGFIAWSDVKQNQAVQRAELDQAKAAQMVQAKAMETLQSDIKDLTKAVSDVRTDVAVLRGRAVEPRAIERSDHR